MRGGAHARRLPRPAQAGGFVRAARRPLSGRRPRGSNHRKRCKIMTLCSQGRRRGRRRALLGTRAETRSRQADKAGPACLHRALESAEVTLRRTRTGRERSGRDWG